MILKKQLKKLKKSKTLENLHLESTKSVEISDEEISSTIPSKKNFDGSSLEFESNDYDAKIEILRKKIHPYLPETLKQVFENCLNKKLPSRESNVQTDEPRVRGEYVQTESFVEKLDREIQTENTERAEKNSQTDVEELQDRQVQTENVVTAETSTETEKIKDEMDSVTQTDPVEKTDSETQTVVESKTLEDSETQTDEDGTSETVSGTFPEKKLENLTKCLEEHANMLEECADYSAELRKRFSSFRENLTWEVRDEEIQTDPFWLPNWNRTGPIPFGCGLTSFIPGRNLFSPMATLLTPLGMIWGRREDETLFPFISFNAFTMAVG